MAISAFGLVNLLALVNWLDSDSYYSNDVTPAGWISLVAVLGLVILFAADITVYHYALLICLCAQIVWLTQHLWFYYRDHLRLGW